MAIFNLGSINIDFVYGLENMPRPGETLAAKSFHKGLGGKGANQSIAIARAGGQVHHIGGLNSQDTWAAEEMQTAGVGVANVTHLSTPTGHAIIYVDRNAENEIVLFQGANWEITEPQIDHALGAASTGDWFLLQNETNNGVLGAQAARARGLKVCYSAAPFDLDLVRDIIAFTDLLVVNEIEHEQIKQAGIEIPENMALLVTLGADGAVYSCNRTDINVAAYVVDPVDTTGAGDTFLGYALAALDRGNDVENAMRQAAAAAAIQVSRHGAAGAIPTMAEIKEFMKDKL